MNLNVVKIMDIKIKKLLCIIIIKFCNYSAPPLKLSKHPILIFAAKFLFFVFCV